MVETLCQEMAKGAALEAENSPEFLSELYAWAVRNGIEGLIESKLYTVVVWIKNCAPEGARLRDVELACMELLCLFIIDDYEGADVEGFFSGYDAILDLYLDDRARRGDGAKARRFVAEGPRFYRAALEFLDMMRARKVSMSRYIMGKKQHLSLIGRRNSLRGSGALVTFDEYFEARKITIYVSQWLTLWEVLEDRLLTEEERSQVERMLKLHCEWQVLINERLSVKRDVKSGTSNLVMILRDEQGISVEEASRRVQLREDIALKDCLAHFESVAAKRDTLRPQMQRYLSVFMDCIRGTLSNYGENTTRYSVCVEMRGAAR